MKALRFVLLALLTTVVSAGAQEASDLAPAAAGWESVPRVIRFSGTLAGEEAVAAPAPRTLGISFALYKDQEGGAPLWMEVQNVEVVRGGRYTVLLGAGSRDGLSLELFASGEARWLGIQPEGRKEEPRILLVSVPYALKAAEAERLSGRPVADFLLADHWKAEVQQEVEAQAQKQVEKSMSGMAVGNITDTASTFSDTNTTQVVLVTQLGTGIALKATSGANNAVNATSAGTAIFGRATGTSGAVHGVIGQSDSTTGRGVRGIATAATGGTAGLQGSSASTAGIGLLGEATAATGVTFGIQGSSTSTTGRGMRGLATAATGSTIGLQGSAASTSGTAIVADAGALTGTTLGLAAIVKSPSGLAARFSNEAGGKLISALGAANNERFAVDGLGNVSADGTVTATAFAGDGSALTGIPSTAMGDITAVNTAAGSGLTGGAMSSDANLTLLTSCAEDDVLQRNGSAWTCAAVGDITAVTTGVGLTGGAASGVASLDLSTAARTRGINFIAGCDTCSLLADTDDQKTIYQNVIGSLTISEVTCFSDAGSPTINLQKDDGTPVDMLSAPLTCSGVPTTGFVGGENALVVSDKIDFKIVSAGGVAKRATVVVKALLN